MPREGAEAQSRGRGLGDFECEDLFREPRDLTNQNTKLKRTPVLG